ncbi:hypothetical protein ACFQ0M_48875 [Kitasatospora aburaviensis]
MLEGLGKGDGVHAHLLALLDSEFGDPDVPEDVQFGEVLLVLALFAGSPVVAPAARAERVGEDQRPEGEEQRERQVRRHRSDLEDRASGGERERGGGERAVAVLLGGADQPGGCSGHGQPGHSGDAAGLQRPVGVEPAGQAEHAERGHGGPDLRGVTGQPPGQAGGGADRDGGQGLGLVAVLGQEPRRVGGELPLHRSISISVRVAGVVAAASVRVWAGVSIC